MLPRAAVITSYCRPPPLHLPAEEPELGAKLWAAVQRLTREQLGSGLQALVEQLQDKVGRGSEELPAWGIVLLVRMCRQPGRRSRRRPAQVDLSPYGIKRGACACMRALPSCTP